MKLTEGIVISCDLEGNVIEILYDGLKSGEYIKVGKPFINFFDKGSQGKAFDFIKKIKNEDAAFDWELNIFSDHKIMVLHLSGFLIEDNILIFGALLVEEMVRLIEESSRINNEQTNYLRDIIKDFTMNLQKQDVREKGIYDELGRLNNDLTTTKRELTKKNIELVKSNQQKEILLKEIHHRVKNNLMIISSLLNLQSSYIKDKESKGIFKESQNRARSMALIHERLYQSTDLKRIDFGDYITSLVNELFHTYVSDPSLIELKINVDDIFLDINTAIPLGLIINEIITNSLKYAFPNGMKGKIIVDFHPLDEHYEFTVNDNGIGFPEDLDYQNTESLGLQIVNRLIDQIDGEITLDRNDGTKFKITFKELEV